MCLLVSVALSACSCNKLFYYTCRPLLSQLILPRGLSSFHLLRSATHSMKSWARGCCDAALRGCLRPRHPAMFCRTQAPWAARPGPRRARLAATFSPPSLLLGSAFVSRPSCATAATCSLGLWCAAPLTMNTARRRRPWAPCLSTSTPSSETWSQLTVVCPCVASMALSVYVLLQS